MLKIWTLDAHLGMITLARLMEQEVSDLDCMLSIRQAIEEIEQLKASSNGMEADE